MRRYQMAAGTSFMVIVLMYVACLLDGLEWVGFVRGADDYVSKPLKAEALQDASLRVPPSIPR